MENFDELEVGEEGQMSSDNSKRWPSLVKIMSVTFEFLANSRPQAIHATICQNNWFKKIRPVLSDLAATLHHAYALLGNMGEKNSTVPELPAEQQLHVEATVDDKQLQPLSSSISSSPSANPSHQKHIMNRLENIRGNKQRILSTLRELKENAKEGEFPNKELMGKMIASYDALTAQEEQYVQLMQKIVSLRENAADDVQHENERNSEKLIMGSDGNTYGSGSVMKENTDELNDKLPDEVINNDLEEMNSELSKLGAVKGKAVAVSIMNDKLLETLQLHRDKKATLEELHRRKRETQKGIADEALQQVEMARLKGKATASILIYILKVVKWS
uniref:Kinesin-related protein 4-like n=1 Tax=Elaeophora elaphi TaxID=1147741 RepID=A0A0R3S0I1_9BILA